MRVKHARVATLVQYDCAPAPARTPALRLSGSPALRLSGPGYRAVPAAALCKRPAPAAAPCRRLLVGDSSLQLLAGGSSLSAAAPCPLTTAEKATWRRGTEKRRGGGGRAFAEPKTKRKWPAVPCAASTKRKRPAAGRSHCALACRRRRAEEEAHGRLCQTRHRTQRKIPAAGRSRRAPPSRRRRGRGRPCHATPGRRSIEASAAIEARGAPVARRAAPEPPQVHSLHIDSRTVAAFYTKPSQDVEAPGASTSSLGFVVGHCMDAYMVWPQK